MIGTILVALKGMEYQIQKRHGDLKNKQQNGEVGGLEKESNSVKDKIEPYANRE